VGPEGGKIGNIDGKNLGGSPKHTKKKKKLKKIPKLRGLKIIRSKLEKKGEEEGNGDGRQLEAV